MYEAGRRLARYFSRALTDSRREFETSHHPAGVF
jgi:hypothetical protein